MIAEHKKNNFSAEANQDFNNLEKTKIERPNIDHLIKKILNERRKQHIKNFLIFSVIVLVAVGSITISVIY